VTTARRNVELLPETELAWFACLALNRATREQVNDLRQVFHCARRRHASATEGFRAVVRRALELRPPPLCHEDPTG
jgi:hypothetical protein